MPLKVHQDPQRVDFHGVFQAFYLQGYSTACKFNLVFLCGPNSLIQAHLIERCPGGSVFVIAAAVIST